MIEDTGVKWYHLSLCRNLDLNLFYDLYESNEAVAESVDNICFDCPIRKVCLREGIENKEYGVWGGVFLVNGKADNGRNSHKTEEQWAIIRNDILGL